VRHGLELARIGFDKLAGYITAEAVTQKQKLPQISVEELKSSLKNNGPLVVDVRTPSEWKSKHIEGATHAPLSSFAKGAPDLPKDRSIAVICGSGYRSSIAASLLRAHGYDTVKNVTGGMTAYDESER
jgi:hydroxyacylglutathione hydrolase